MKCRAENRSALLTFLLELCKMLSQQLRDLEECGMIHREVIPEKPPKTLYSLTAFGKSIIPVLDSMCNWGIHFLEGLDITPPCGSKL